MRALICATAHRRAFGDTLVRFAAVDAASSSLLARSTPLMLVEVATTEVRDPRTFLPTLKPIGVAVVLMDGSTSQLPDSYYRPLRPALNLLCTLQAWWR